MGDETDLTALRNALRLLSCLPSVDGSTGVAARAVGDAVRELERLREAVAVATSLEASEKLRIHIEAPDGDLVEAVDAWVAAAVEVDTADRDAAKRRAERAETEADFLRGRLRDEEALRG